MKIKFLNGSESGSEREYTLFELTIGREEGNTICLDSAGVSRYHAKLYRDGSENWFVSDCNSTNGVKVNGNRIFNDTRVQEGDVLDIGQQQLMILCFNPQSGPVIFNPVISAPRPDTQKILPSASPLEKTIQIPTSPQIPTPAAQQETPPKEAESKNAFANLKNLGPLFSRGNKKEGAQGESKGSNEKENKKKRLHNLLFYVILGCVVICVLSSVLKGSAPQKSSGAAPAQPLALTYEKMVISKDNIFRFEFKIFRKKVQTPVPSADGTKKIQQQSAAPALLRWSYIGAFTLDDLGSQRHYARETELSDETVDRMRSVISSSGILALQDYVQPPDRTMNRKLQIVLGSKILKFSVPGEFAGNEFSSIEEAVLGIAESFGLETIMQTPEQLLSQAEQNFLKAEDLYSNRVKPSNLRDAIIRYRAVVNSLEQFSPKPAMWDQARKKLNAAEEERKARLKSMNSEFTRLRQIQDYEAMRSIFLQIMELTEPESRTYNAAKKRLIIIDQTLRKKRK